MSVFVQSYSDIEGGGREMILSVTRILAANVAILKALGARSESASTNIH